MLLRFRVANHASLRDEQELSLVAQTGHASRAEGEVPRSEHRVVPVAAVYGPNASGKSNVIDAITWMRWAVVASFRHWDPSGGVPRRRFAFREDGASHPSEFGIEFVVDGVRFEYGFTVDDQRVREEWLFSYPEGRPRRLFERHPGDEIRFGRGLAGQRKTIAALLRPNSLYLSVAAAQGHPLLGSLYQWFQRGLGVAMDSDFHRRLNYTVDRYLSGRSARGDDPLLALLRFADLGVSDLEVEDPEPEVEAERERVLAALRDAIGDRVTVDDNLGETVRVRHRTADGTYTLRLGEESSGTRTWIGLLGPVLSTLQDGSVLCVDELDARLHPYLSDALVGLFQSPKTNVLGAQLIFSTHEASLLGRNSRTELLRDQVWFTEKEPATGATRVFPMTDFHVRDGVENLEKRYLVGRYGAVPFLDEGSLNVFTAADKGGHGGAEEQATRPSGEDAA